MCVCSLVSRSQLNSTFRSRFVWFVLFFCRFIIIFFFSTNWQPQKKVQVCAGVAARLVIALRARRANVMRQRTTDKKQSREDKLNTYAHAHTHRHTDTHIHACELAKLNSFYLINKIDMRCKLFQICHSLPWPP